MKITWKWLKEYIDAGWSAQEFIEKMMMLGLEVEIEERLGEALKEVVVGQINKIEPHPEADHLVVCQINTGLPADLNIVCGAKNMKEGDKVAVATDGVALPNGMKIKKTKLRGVPSEGMLCSDVEMGLGKDASGIKILPEDSKLGQPLPEAIGLDDVIMEVSITANRPDYLSMIGIARDIAAATGAEIRMPEFHLKESGEEAADVSSVKITAPDLCPRYTARIIKEVEVGPSPDWLKARLESVGMRSINNVVDATNYVLWELGHPMHAFDMDKLKEERIVVRRAKDGESIRTLDGAERKLTSEMLVIADAEVPVALAGIMGGADSEVTERTTNVLLESAYFDAVSTRKTSRETGLSTEASYRFERGADYLALMDASDRCAAMIQELAGGTVLRGVIDAEPEHDRAELYEWPRKVELRKQRVSKILGVEIQGEDIENILARLQLIPERLEGDRWEVKIPSFRVDLFREIDLIEEIARLYGYDRIESSLPRLEVTAFPKDNDYKFQAGIIDLMVGAGLQEVVTYSFMGKSDLDGLDLADDDPLRNVLILSNPLSQEECLLRSTVIPRLLKVYDHNQRRGRRNVAIFEVAQTYQEVDKGVDERTKLAILLAGELPNHWSVPAREWDFFDAKGIMEFVLDSVRARKIRTDRSSVPFLEKDRGIDVQFENLPLGFYGELSGAICEKMDFLSRVLLIELDLGLLKKSAGEDERKLTVPSPYPAMDRDIAILVPLEVSNEAILSAIRKAGKSMLESVGLFDRYRGKQVGEGLCSLAYRLVYRAPDRTLTEEEVNKRHERILTMLEKQFGAKLRG